MPRSHLRLILLSLTFLLGTLPLCADPSKAESLLQQGRVDEATVLLQQTLKAQPTDAYSHQLLCRVFYAQNMAGAAVNECQQAVAAAPGNSEDQMWLGRAYGMKAATANPIVAFSIARKVCAAFERAVQLDSANVQAMSDLGEFYVAAPSIVGGGLDKAERLAAQMQPRSPARAHRLLAQIATKKKELSLAEAEFKAAVRAGNRPETYIDLGQFYAEHDQPDKAVAALQSGIGAVRAKNAVLVDAASILTTAHRSPELAERLLRDYLSSSAKTDDAPAFKVHVQLGDLLLQRGDSAGAHREYVAALALASNYAPARKALESA